MLRWRTSDRHGRTLSVADTDNAASCAIAAAMGERLEQELGVQIKEATKREAEPGNALQNALRDWLEQEIRGRGLEGQFEVACNRRIDRFHDYSHLGRLQQIIDADQTGELSLALSGEYLVAPDVVIGWVSRPWSEIDLDEDRLTAKSARAAFLHASVSCKWTIRSDRAQNVRLEATNLASKRRGRMPHFVFVTCEPLPSRLQSVARGDGALDCTYHVALGALWYALHHARASADSIGAQRDVLRTLIQAGKIRPLTTLAHDLLTFPKSSRSASGY
ncbi:MAG: hypothetical protein HY320_12410 [Armatimonadetes bacterium]|nr:hypothetical protein [Armatimonadota bacterium]